MRELTEKLPNFLPGREPYYQTEASSFFTTFYNLNWRKNGRIPIEEVAKRVNSTLEKSPVNEKKFGEKQESSVKAFDVNDNSSEKRFGEVTNKPKNTGKTAQRIIDLVISDPSMSAEAMAYKTGISSRAVEKQIAKLRSMGILSREGADFGGYWRIITNP